MVMEYYFETDKNITLESFDHLCHMCKNDSQYSDKNFFEIMYLYDFKILFFCDFSLNNNISE